MPNGSSAPQLRVLAEENTMDAAAIEHRKRVSRLEDELANFRSMMEYVNWIPDEVSLANIEVFGQAFPLNGILGGDHIILVDFKRRYNLEARIARARRDGRDDVARRLAECNDRVGVLLADSCGHFLTGVLYELETHGHVTAKLFDILNTRFQKSSSVSKFITMIYGEISEDGTFRFISAGHPKPLVYSAEFDRLVDIDPKRTRNFLPIGIFPSEGPSGFFRARETSTNRRLQCRCRPRRASPSTRSA